MARHSWERIADHTRRCRRCGLVKKDFQLARVSVSMGSTGHPSGYWVTTWTTAAGGVTSSRTDRQPACTG